MIADRTGKAIGLSAGLGDFGCASFFGADIAIIAGVVNFLLYPNPPRTRSIGSKKLTNDLGLV